jgi:hypothetical protein
MSRSEHLFKKTVLRLKLPVMFFRLNVLLIFLLALNLGAQELPFDWRDEGPKWAIKTNLLTPFVGEFSLSGEYKFNSSYTLEVGAGLLTRNYIASSSSGVPLLGGGAGGCYECDYNLNVSLFLRGRYFISGKSYDGGFLGLLIHRKPFDGRISIQGIESGFQETASELGLFFGMQGTYWNNVLVEYYFGTSVRMVDFDRPFYDFTDPEPVVFRETISETGLGLFFGVQVGGLFN